jgi:protein involved in polysaccharide export with SLBB domain
MKLYSVLLAFLSCLFFSSSSFANEYLLGSGDKLRLNVFGEQDLSGEFEINGAGFISLPLLGQIPAKDYTTSDLEKIISAMLAEGYLVDPKVSIEVINFRPFFILGEVNQPGQYPYVSDLSVVNAVAMAGGYTARASKSSVLIKRTNPDGTTEELTAKENDRVQPNDVITVEERFF